MLDYKIFILDQQGSITLSYDFKGPDDLSALDESRKYSGKHSVEFWERMRQVARIDQGGARPRAPGFFITLGDRTK